MIPNTNNGKAMEMLDAITNDGARESALVASNGNDIPLFGYIVAYTLGEARIPHDEARRIWDARGIVIKPASHIDALKRAITRYSQVEHNYADAEGNELSCVFRVRFKGLDETDAKAKVDNYIWEVSIHETKNARETQHHESLYQIIGTKRGKTIAMHDITTKDVENGASEHIRTRAMQIYNTIISEYESLTTNISNDQIRDTLISELKMKDGVPFVVGRGGAWFVPLKSRDFVLNVKAAIKDTRAYARNKLDVRIIPVMRDEDLKASIAEDVATHVKTEYETLLRETLRKLERTNDEDARVSVLQDAISEKATMMGLKDRYETLLSTTIELTLDDTPDTSTSSMSERVSSLIAELKGVD